MNRREIIALLIVAAAVFAFFLIATPRPPSAGYTVTHVAPQGWRAIQDDTNQTIHIRWLMTGRQASKPFKLAILEQRFNVRIEPVYLTPEAMMMAQPLMLAAGDIPDLMDPGGNVSLRKYAYHGYLAEIPYEMLVAYAPHIVRLIDTYVPYLWPALALDGHNYAVPSLWYGGLRPRLGIWRQDWLARVGIHRLPETLEDYHTAFRKFRNEDPDGNGLKDTYGLTGDLMSPYVTFTEIFGAFGVLPYDWMEQDGEVVWGGVQPGARQALAVLRQWYAEDLIHPDFLTDHWYREVDAKFKNGRVGYVNYMASYEAFNPDNPTSLINVMKDLQPTAVLTPGVAPLGPTGLRGHRVWGAAGGSMLTFGRQVADDPRKMIRALRMLDAMVADEDLYVLTTIGQRGVHWDWLDPRVGPGSGIRFLPPYDTKQARELAGFPGDSVLLDGTDPSLFEKYLPAAMVQWEKQHRRIEWGRADLFNWPSAVPRAEEYLADLQRLQQTVYADIIRGTKPLEAFDEFVRQWHAQGGDELLTEARKTFAEAKTIRSKLSKAIATP